MTRKQALAELIAKVEAGEWLGNYDDTRLSGINAHSYGLNKSGIVWEAYNGSLDAALALHEAVLPDWGFEVCEFCAAVSNRYTDGGPDMYKWFEVMSETPARAWLLAILKALHAQETDE